MTKKFFWCLDLKTGGIVIAILGIILSTIQILASVVFIFCELHGIHPEKSTIYEIGFHIFSGLASTVVAVMYFDACYHLLNGTQSVSWSYKMKVLLKNSLTQFWQFYRQTHSKSKVFWLPNSSQSFLASLGLHLILLTPLPQSFTFAFTSAFIFLESKLMNLIHLMTLIN